MTRRKKQSNPSAALTTALAVGTGIAAMGAGYGAYHVVQRRRRAKALSGGDDPVAALQGVVGNASVADVPTMMQNVRQPILLRATTDPLALAEEFERVPVLRVRLPNSDQVTEPVAAIFGTSVDDELVLIDDDIDQQIYPTPAKAIGQLLTGLSADATMMAYEIALHEIENRGVVWPEQRDEAIARILRAVAPRLDWSQGLRPYTYDSLPWRAWSGVQLVGTVANQSYWNTQAQA